MEDLEYQSREFRLYPLENGESLSFRKGNSIAKSSFKNVFLSMTYRVNQQRE